MSRHAGGKEPSLTDKTDRVSFIQALNYYSQYHSAEDSKKWALEWLFKNQPVIYEAVKDAKDYQFSNRGFVTRIIERGYKPSEEMIHKLVEFFKSITTATITKSVLDNSPEPKKDEKPHNPVIWKLEDVIDAVLSEKEKPEVGLVFEKSVLNEARQWIDIQEIEYQETLRKCESILEEFKKISDKIDIIGGKSLRKSSPVAAKSGSKIQDMRNAAKLVELVKCPLKIDEFGFTGLSPLKIIGAKRIALYHTSFRCVLIYVAQEGQTLSVSRTALKNFDPSKSVCKTVRNPKKFFSALNDNFNPFYLFEDIKTSARQSRCRLNEEVVVIAVE